MWLLKQIVTFLVVLGVSSSAVHATTSSTTTAASTTTPSPTSVLTPSSPSGGEGGDETVVVPISIGQVETAATVIEVKDDWSDDEESQKDDQNDDSGDEELTTTDEQLVEHEEENASAEEEEDVIEIPTEEEFKANVPESLHYDRDIMIHRDNLIPILHTLVQASTHKKNPSYTELLKAGGITAFKTSLKYIGEEKMGVNLLTLAKKLTTLFDDDEADEDEESKMLSKMAEDFLRSHRFKLVLPESLLLHEKEMTEFMSRTESEMAARAATSESELTIVTGRQDPGVTTLLSKCLSTSF